MAVGLATMVTNDYRRACVETADASTIQVESSSSRARRPEIRIYHRMARKYLDRYAAGLG